MVGPVQVAGRSQALLRHLTINTFLQVATGAAFRTRYFRDVLKDEKADQVGDEAP